MVGRPRWYGLLLVGDGVEEDIELLGSMTRLLSESVILVGLSFLVKLALVTGGDGVGLEVLRLLTGNLEARGFEVSVDTGDDLCLGVMIARGAGAF